MGSKNMRNLAFGSLFFCNSNFKRKSNISTSKIAQTDCFLETSLQKCVRYVVYTDSAPTSVDFVAGTSFESLAVSSTGSMQFEQTDNI